MLDSLTVTVRAIKYQTKIFKGLLMPKRIESLDINYLSTHLLKDY